MTRRRRTTILATCDAALRSRLCEEARAAADVREVEPPTECLVMLTVREPSQGTVFHLGEVLVTRARARIGDVLGLGILAGSRPAEARELAVIDAAFRAGLPQAGAWIALLEQEEQGLDRARARDEAALLDTRVDFALMD